MHSIDITRNYSVNTGINIYKLSSHQQNIYYLYIHRYTPRVPK